MWHVSTSLPLVLSLTRFFSTLSYHLKIQEAEVVLRAVVAEQGGYNTATVVRDQGSNHQVSADKSHFSLTTISRWHLRVSSSLSGYNNQILLRDAASAHRWRSWCQQRHVLLGRRFFAVDHSVEQTKSHGNEGLPLRILAIVPHFIWTLSALVLHGLNMTYART